MVSTWMPKPCGPCSDSPESFRTMRPYFGCGSFLDGFDARLVGVLFAAMRLQVGVDQIVGIVTKNRSGWHDGSATGEGGTRAHCTGTEFWRWEYRERV